MTSITPTPQSPKRSRKKSPEGTSGRAWQWPAGRRRSTPLWLRTVFVLAFTAAVVLEVWWAVCPDLSDSDARPGRVPSFLILLPLVLFVLVVFQVSSRVPMLVPGVALLLLVPAQWVLVQAAETGYHNLVMHRSPSAQVLSGTRLASGPTRVRLRLQDGRTVGGLFTLPGRTEAYMRHSNSGYLTLQPGRYGPFAGSLPSRQDVLVDPSGRSPVVDAGADDTLPAGRRQAALWLGATVLLWAPILLLALSSLLRRRSYWDVPPDQMDAELR